MKIIAGLGNPGSEYAATKHNVGFMLVDALADKLGIDSWQDKFDAKVAQGFMGTEKILLVKPLTYMNESGRAIGPLLNFYKLETEDLIVVHDDMDIPAGTVRIRKKGSAGGHNGMKSIINHLGTDAFPRVRVGIGGERHPDMDLADYVLSRFQGKEAEDIDMALDKAAKAAELFAGDQLDEAMNLYSVGKKKRGGRKGRRTEERPEGQTEEKSSQAHEEKEEQAGGKGRRTEEQTREVSS